MFDFAGRVQNLQALMAERQVDAMVLTAGSDLPYFSGYTAMPLERITAFVVTQQGDPVLFVPALEAPRVEVGQFDVVSWGETDDPFAMITLQLDGSTKVAVGETMWSGFLLGFQSRMGDVEWSVASELTKELRMHKEDGEIDRLRSAAEATDRVLRRVPDEVPFAGREERHIAADFARLTVEEGHDTAWFTIVASGPNSASPHHETGDRVVEVGDLVVCDFGGTIDGYHSDVTRTFAVGRASQRQRDIHNVVNAANDAGRAAVSPGVPCEEVDRAARSVIQQSGYGDFFIHRTGHGIGLDGHEHPYLVRGNQQPLGVGMTFSIEPGIYIPGEFGVRIEDIVACGPESADELNRANRDLIEVS